MIELYDYQKNHADKLEKALLSYGVVKDASDTGTGKTYTACAVADRLAYTRIVVVCPKAVIPAWQRVLALTKYTDRECFVVNYEKLKAGNHALLIRKGKTFRWNTPRTTLIIFDEDHKLAGRLTLNARLLYQARTQRYDCMLLGATSFTSPLQMDAIGFALGLHKGYRNFTEWLLHVGCYKDMWGAWQPPKNLTEVLEKVHNYIYPNRGARMLVDDIPNFPENNIIVDSYAVPKPAEVAQLYSQIADKLDELKQKMANDGDSVLTDMLRLRQQIEMAKVPSLYDLARSDFHAGKRVAIFVNFRDTQNLLRDKIKQFSPFISEIHGDQTAEERQKAIDLFQSNVHPVLIATISSGGVGISLHDENGNYPRSSIICPSFSAVDLRQALGRIHRANSKSKSVQRIVLASDTIEDSICSRLRIKLKSLDTINDTDLSPFNN
jgi:superfamily II DNA or RNA helicase